MEITLHEKKAEMLFEIEYEIESDSQSDSFFFKIWENAFVRS